MATLRGRVLLGWMDRAQGVGFLLNNCFFDPPIDAIRAEEIWREFRLRAEALPDRAPGLLPHLPLDQKERFHAQQFMRYLKGLGSSDVINVIKVDLSQLGAIQYDVVTERSEAYAKSITTDGDWRRECLPLRSRNSPIKVTASLAGRNLTADVDIPHAEHVFTFDPKAGFAIAEFQRHVTTLRTANRYFLSAGYHRSFAKVLAAPTATVPSAVVALTSNTLAPPPAHSIAAGLTTGIERLSPFGACPARLADFFTDGLFMNVDLRKKRYQLQVRSTWVVLDDPT